LAVVEGWGEAVDSEVGVFNEGGLAPLSGGYSVGRLDVAVNCVELDYCEIKYGKELAYRCPEC
jgi:hypothetical protein